MKLFTKFYDIATAEPATQIEQPSIAALMAKQGIVNSTSEMVATPIDITQRKEETKPATEATPAETATSTSTTAPTTSETAKPIEETTKVQPTQIASEDSRVSSWQEVLKSQQPDTVLKELGFDDKTVRLFNRIKEFDPKVLGLIQSYEEGKHVEYLRELSTDYSKMSDEDVMRHQLRRDYPRASDKALDALFKKEVTQLYGLDSEDDDERAEGKLLLEAKADLHRNQMVENQQNYLVPKAPEHKPLQAVDNSAEEDKRKFEVYRSQFNDNQYTKDIFTNKVIAVGDGDEKFTYTVDPQAIVKVLFNGEKWMEKMSVVTDNPDGSRTFVPDTKKQFLVGMIAEYGENFLIEYAKHFKSLGGKTVVETLENAKPSDTTSASASQKGYESVAEAMAKQGRVNYGG